MAEIINMPRLSDTMEEGTVAKWFKKVGDKVNEGDILAEIETDKATMEFESFNEGELLHIGIEEGGTAPVDTLLAIIGSKGEDISDLLRKGESKSSNENQLEEKIVISNEKESNSIPDGVEIINMPRLSDTMEEGTVAKWNKNVGDLVKEGDILAEIETDKATMEFESFYSGELLHIGLKEGESAPVDSILAIIGKAGTNVSKILSLDSNTMLVNNSENKNEVKPEKNSKENSDLIDESKNNTTEIVSELPTNFNSNGRIIASPLAKKLATEKGIDLNYIKGTGDSGRIIKRDIDNFNPQHGRNTQSFTPIGSESITEIAN